MKKLFIITANTLTREKAYDQDLYYKANRIRKRKKYKGNKVFKARVSKSYYNRCINLVILKNMIFDFSLV